MDDRTTAAFWERFTRNPYGCLVWTGYYNPRTRYGSFTHVEDGKSVTSLAHRLAWELLAGPIPEGMIIDHGNPERGCLNRGCGEPSHLEPITQAENVRRRVGHDDGGAFHRNKTHCPQGHPYEGENLYTKKDGSRHCRACARATSAAYAAQKREENPTPPRIPQQFCKRGHEFTPENTYVIPSTGSRSCKECKRADVQRYREKPRSEVKYRAEICKNGHAMDGSNSSYASNGTRICKACGREKAQRHAQKVAVAAKAAGLTVRAYLASQRSV